MQWFPFICIACFMLVVGLGIGWIMHRHVALGCLTSVFISILCFVALTALFGDMTIFARRNWIALAFYYGEPFLVFFFLPTTFGTAIMLAVRGFRRVLSGI